MCGETAEERQVRHLLEHLGYSVERLETQESVRTADFLVSRGEERHIVEVKARDPDHDYARQLEERGRAASERRMVRANVVSGRVREAVDQLDATFPEDQTLCRIVALVAPHDDPDFHLDQFKKTIFGIVDLLSDHGGTARAIPCYYFTYSDFFRFHSLDGALLLSRRGARLCLNSHGSRYARVTKSAMCEAMRAVEALDDPPTLEARGEAYIADTPLPRSDEEAVLAYVREKYARPELITYKPTKIRVSIRVSAEHVAPPEPE